MAAPRRRLLCRHVVLLYVASCALCFWAWFYSFWSSPTTKADESLLLTNSHPQELRTRTDQSDDKSTPSPVRLGQ